MPMTDAELRRQLAKNGINPGPITDTTRSVYIKKLERLKNERKPNASREVRSSSIPALQSERKRSKSPILRSDRSTRNLKSLVGYSTDEDDQSQTNSKEINSSQIRKTRSIRSSLNISRNLDSKGSTPLHRRVKDLTSPQKTTTNSPRRSSSLQPTNRYSDDSDDASERSSVADYVEIKSIETNTSPSLQRNIITENPRFKKFREEIEAWKREEAMRNPSPSQRSTSHFTRRNGSINSSFGVITQLSEKNSLGDHPKDSKCPPWTLSFSSFLPIGTCIFFIILGLLYATMKYDTSLNPQQTLAYDSQKEDGLLTAINGIYEYVSTEAGERECDGDSFKGFSEVSRMRKQLDIDEDTFYQAGQKFLEHDWGIQFFDKSNSPIKGKNKFADAYYADSQYPFLSGWCRFTRAVQKVFLRIVFTTVVGIAIWLGLVYRRHRIERQRKEREQMYMLVQKILDVLRRQYDMSENNENSQPYLPILHVRDMIIPPKDRKKMAKIWERAKQFLSASETRIRVENQTIQGEDYLVWRWIQASSPAKRHTPTSRVWQGEAFDISKGPMVCPTPCLKLRNVFNLTMEVDKNWIEQIQDSILEKCQGNNEILRICVEKDSKEGLVYMLCASKQAAGRAFQALHGAWFDGRLVTVKFIRLHRFHQRFPDSVNQSDVPMRPTSQLPVSTILSTNSPTDNQQTDRLYPTLPDD